MRLSPLAKIATLLNHAHGAQKVYPTLANAVVVTGAAGAWTLGAFTEIVPADTITGPFDIHGVQIEAFSASDPSELVLYAGLAGFEVEIGRLRAVGAAGATDRWEESFQCPIQPANTRISAKLATKTGGSETVAVSIRYHTY